MRGCRQDLRLTEESKWSPIEAFQIFVFFFMYLTVNQNPEYFIYPQRVGEIVFV